MAAIPFAAGFDTGLTTMGFVLLNPDGTEFAARSTVGVTEVGVGRYATTETVPDANLPLVVQWDDAAGGQAVAGIPAPVVIPDQQVVLDEILGLNNSIPTAENIAIEVDERLLDAGDATDLIASIVSRIGNTNVDETTFIAALRADIERAGGLLAGAATATDLTALTNAVGQIDVTPTVEAPIVNVEAPVVDTTAFTAAVDAVNESIGGLNNFDPATEQVTTSNPATTSSVDTAQLASEVVAQVERADGVVAGIASEVGKIERSATAVEAGGIVVKRLYESDGTTIATNADGSPAEILEQTV